MSTVLVVDDQATNRALVCDLLTFRGHTVIEAHEGAEALALAHDRHPDLVITDVLMPGMDGYQLAQELRAAPDTADTPIVFLTANYLPAEARPVADACGVADVLLKSVDPHTLLTAVERAITDHPRHSYDLEQAAHARRHAVDAKLVEHTRALAETSARLQLMADHSPVGAVFGDRHGTADYVNGRFAAIMGQPADDLLGPGWLQCLAPDQREQARTLPARAQATALRHRGPVTMPDTTTRWLDVHIQTIPDDGAPHGFIAIVDDITTVIETEHRQQATERQRLIDARTQATERLDGLRRLAGGIAHDFNNILGAVLGYEALLTDTITGLTDTGQLPADTARLLLDDLSQIRTGGNRATDLTQQLLTVGSSQHLTPTPVDLNTAIRESTQLIAPSLGPHIQITTHLADDLRPVLAEPGSLSQILLNLTTNARDAMPSGGTTTNHQITTGDTDHSLPVGHYARLTLHDTGHGMTPETLHRAIEPFFTTKPKGHGTGLGLATTYGLVNQFSGTLDIRSAPHAGTTITIDLPTTDQPAPPPPPTPTEPTGGTGTVLVVDDEPGIRDTITRHLTRAGYTVITAATGTEALHQARHHAPIRLLLTDVVMPAVTGPELAQHLTTEHPGTTVLFMSGYADGLTDDHGILPPDTALLPKPFTRAQLLTAIHEALTTQPHTSGQEHPRPTAAGRGS